MSIPAMICPMNRSRDQMVQDHQLADLNHKIGVQIDLEGKAQGRAITFAGFFLAGTTALGITGLEFFQENKSALAFGCFSSAASFYIGALACAAAGWPGKMSSAGLEANIWDWIAEETETEQEILSNRIDDAKERLVKNQSVMQRSRQWFRLGGTAGLISPVIGLAVWFKYLT